MALFRARGISLSKLFIIFVLCTFSQAWAANNCAPKLANKRSSKEQNLQAKFGQLSQREFIKDILDAKTVAKIAKDQDLPIYAKRLQKVFDALINDKKGDSRAIIIKVLSTVLNKEFVPRTMVVAGVDGAKKGDVSSIYRMLGSLTFAETREIYFGPFSQGSPSPSSDSLVQKYIDETGAETKLMRMRSVANNKNVYAEDRLAVAVSEKSFPVFLKYFSGKTMFSVFGHANIFHAGQAYGYNGGITDLHALTPNTPLPLVILKPSEGERMFRYMELTAKPAYAGWGNPLKIPWELPGYTDEGVYTCCTHFIGNIPIGDRLVTAYRFPKNREYGANVTSKAKKLREWSEPAYADLKNVWTAPGHEQLSGVLGQIKANVAGEFASPGWVIETLMGSTTNERVPVIFFFAADHHDKIPDEPEWHFEGPH